MKSDYMRLSWCLHQAELRIHIRRYILEGIDIEKFDLNPKIEIECPFCGGKYKRDLETLPYFEIECPCGALIEFAADFEFGGATLKEE